MFKETLVISNVYFPTKDIQSEPIALLEKLESILNSFEDETIILGGDFNIVLDPIYDKIGGSKKNTTIIGIILVMHFYKTVSRCLILF